MTLASTPPIVTYAENGSTLAFAVPYQFQAAADLVVVRQDPTGARTTATLGTDYSVSGGAGATGTVTMIAAKATGWSLEISRFTARTQSLDLTPGDTFPAESVEKAFDRGVAIAQEIEAEATGIAGRALQVPKGEIVAALPAASARANMILGFGGTGGLILQTTAQWFTGFTVTVTSAPGQSVSTRGALAGIVSPVGWQTAYLSQDGQEGTFKFKSGDRSASVTADPLGGEFLAPAASPTGSSGAWARPKSELYEALATNWGCKFDGSTDDTTAFQGTLLYCANNGYTMRCPAGTAIINGPLQDAGVSDAQILFPRITDINSPVGVRIKGASPVPLTCEPTSGNYTVIKSNLAGTGSLFGGKSASGFQNRTCISLYMEDIISRLPQNSAAIGIDLRYVHMNRLENVRVDVPDVFNCVQPTHTTNVGIYSPLDNVSAWSLWNNVVVAGYYRGVRIGELVTIGHVNAAMCLWPISTQIGSHAANILSGLVTNSPNTILVDGSLQFKDSLLNIEHDKTAAHGGSGPDWVELGVDQTATRTGYDIFDTDGSLSGDITLQMHDTSIPLNIHPGATNVSWKELRPAGTTSYGLLFPGMAALTNAASVRTIRGKNGGWPWASFIQPSSTLTDQVAVISAAGASGGPETRVGQINVGYDGAVNSGIFTFTTWNGGGAHTALTLDSSGHPAFPSATTTASAANAFLDSGNNNQLIRSTSSRIYKRDVEPLETAYADRLLDLRPVWYRSTASADNPAWGYYGLIAEDVAAVDPRLVHWGYQDDQLETYEMAPATPEVRNRKGKVVKKADPALVGKRPRAGEAKRPDGVQYERLAVLLLDVVRRERDERLALTKRVAALEGRPKGAMES